MTPRLPRVSGKDVVLALIKHGYKLIHIRGSHHYLEPPDGGTLVTVPVHGKEILKPKTLKSILKQANITIDQLIKWL